MIKSLLIINSRLQLFAMKNFLPILLAVLVVSCSTSKKSTGIDINPYQYSITKKVIAQKGAVVSAHPLASKVGVEVLKKGGNAFNMVNLSISPFP